jgi:hypothetical protein
VNRFGIAFAILLTVTLLSHPSYAAGNDVASLDDAVQQAFAARGRVAMGDSPQLLSSFYVPGSRLLAHEAGRPAHFRQLEAKWKTRVLDIRPNARTISSSIDGDTARVEVYELTYFDWEWAGRVITSGYGVYHSMVWRKDVQRWRVISDSYDEGPLTGVKSPDFLEIPAMRPSPPPVIADEKSPSVVMPYTWGYCPYDRTAAVNHAEDHWSSYAPEYQNMNPLGGDCANYVSQCIAAGKAPFVGFGVNVSTSWWYDNKGTPGPATADDVWSTTWSYVPAQRPYMLYMWGVQAQASALQRGDVVYYDWTSDGVWDHAAIVVVGAAENNGLALVNSHNDNKLHVPWNYGYSNTLRSPVHLLDSLPVFID